VGTKPLFAVKFYLKCIPDNDLKEALKIIFFNSVQVLETIRDNHVSDTKDTEYHPTFDLTSSLERAY